MEVVEVGQLCNLIGWGGDVWSRDCEGGSHDPHMTG